MKSGGIKKGELVILGAQTEKPKRNYKNYSDEHFEAAREIFATGLVSKNTSIWMTQSDLPGETYIPDDVELLYPHRITINE